MFFHLVFYFASALFSLMGKESSLSVVYLSYQDDPSHTIVVHWHAAEEHLPEVSYRLKGEEKWSVQEGRVEQLKGSRVCVHSVHLAGLIPDTEYEIDIENESFRFRTLPEHLSRPVQFVVGGDALFYRKIFQRMNAQIAKQNPDFIVVGGDIAYTCGVPGFMQNLQSASRRWHIFFTEWKKTLKTSDGRLIPIVPVVGNHDVRSADHPKATENYFYTLFSLKEEDSYRVLDMGTYLSLFVLDTGHSCKIKGDQAEWLKAKLAQREDRRYKMAAYHIGAYPSVYPFTARTSEAIREAWVTLFERYHLHCAFEHHNHAYKRTFPIKEGRIDPSGVVYMGDGSWGVHARLPKDLWYLARGEKANAVCLVTLTRGKAEVEALCIDGKKIDAVSFLPTQVSRIAHLLE